jgi:hypothetical protein
MTRTEGVLTGQPEGPLRLLLGFHPQMSLDL